MIRNSKLYENLQREVVCCETLGSSKLNQPRSEKLINEVQAFDIA